MKSGVYIKVKKKVKDVLELTDKEFLSLLNNELDHFKFENGSISLTLKTRVLETYLMYVKKSPEDRDRIRISALMVLEDMGRRFAKVLPEWDACIKELGLTKEK